MKSTSQRMTQEREGRDQPSLRMTSPLSPWVSAQKQGGLHHQNVLECTFHHQRPTCTSLSPAHGGHGTRGPQKQIFIKWMNEGGTGQWEKVTTYSISIFHDQDHNSKIIIYYSPNHGLTAHTHLEDTTTCQHLLRAEMHSSDILKSSSPESQTVTVFRVRGL